MDEQVVPGRLFTSDEVTIIVEERDCRHRELEEDQRRIENLNTEV